MPLKKVLADIGRGVWSPSKKSQKNNQLFFNSSKSPNSPHIYYEPPDEFDWAVDSALIPDSQGAAGEVIVHRKDVNTTKSQKCFRLSPSKSVDQLQSSKDTVIKRSPDRAYTEEEFTSAILARTHQAGNHHTNRENSKSSPSELPGLTTAAGSDEISFFCRRLPEIPDSGSAAESSTIKLSGDIVGVNMCENGNSTSITAVKNREGSRKSDNNSSSSSKRSSGLKPDANRKSDHSVSPLPERRNKSVLGRLKSFASRTSYSTSEDGHSHSSDYEEPEEDKKVDLNFQRDAKERSSASWVRHLRRDVKKRISRLKNSRGSANGDEGQEAIDGHVQAGSSMESIPSGSGSSLQPPTPTSSNRSSTSAGEEDNAVYVGAFIGRARALVDYTPSPYDKDGLAFKKGDIIDIIAKHKTGIWVGMALGKVGHFKFINVEEIPDECEPRRKKHRVPAHWLSTARRPETLEELLKQLGLQEYTNVLVLNGYDELDTFKEIEKEDLDSLGIINPEHGLKLLRAAEMLHSMCSDVCESAEDQLRQSRRDSGCYGSHENLVQDHQAQNDLHDNGQLEDEIETSHSESGIHSREGADLTLAMNNLDLSAESSTKSTTTTLDSREDVAAIINNASECGRDPPSTFNILPSYSPEQQGESNACESVQPTSSDLRDSNASPPVESQFVPVTTFANSISSSPSTDNCVFLKCNSVPSIPEGTMPVPSATVTPVVNGHKNSPSNQKGNNRGKNKTAKSKHDGQRHARSVSKSSDAELYGERNSYIYGWSSFAKKDKRSRKVQEYDDVVSDPAVEPEKSPIKHVYRRAKHRKGSLQELVHNPKPPSSTLVSQVKQKLERENVFLFEEPYTDKTGFCGIPPALVQRYAEELNHHLPDVANALDQIRITSLQQQARRGVPNDFLADSCTIPVIEANYSCLRTWLISLGLPMYESNFKATGHRTLDQVSQLGFNDLGAIGVQDARHQVFLEAAIATLRTRMGMRTTCSSPERRESPSSPFTVL